MAREDFNLSDKPRLVWSARTGLVDTEQTTERLRHLQRLYLAEARGEHPPERRVRPLRSLNGPDYNEEHHRTDGGDPNTTNQTAISPDTKGTKQKAADESADYANNEITDRAEASALNQNTCQPASDKPDDKKPDKVHCALLALKNGE
jgi:hypothetical protein